MSNRFTLTSRILIFFLLLTVSIISIVLLFLGELRLLFYGSYAIVPIVIAVAISRRINHNSFRRTWTEYGEEKVLRSAFFIILSVGVFSLSVTEVRPFIFFILSTICGSLIYVQVRNSGGKLEKSILIELTTYILFLIWSLSLNYWYFTGGTDIFGHVAMVESLLDDGVMPSHHIYNKFPLWHLLVAFVYRISGSTIPIHKMMFLTSGLVFSSIPVLVYSVSGRISGSKRVGLLSSLLSVVNVTVLYYGAYSISRSIVLVLLVALFHQLFLSKNPRNVLLFSILSVATIIYHPSSPPFIVPVLVLISFVCLLYRTKSPTTNQKRIATLSGVFGLFVLTYWMFSAVSIPQALVGTIASLIEPAGQESVSTFGDTLTDPSIQDLYPYLPYGLLIGLVVFSLRFTLRDDETTSVHRSGVIIGAILAAVAFPNPLKSLEIVGSLNFDRWGIYTQFFTSLTAATGTLELIRRITKPLYQAFLTIGIVILIFTSLTNPLIAADNPQFSDDASTPYLSQGEIDAVDHATEVAPDLIMSDYVVTRYLDVRTRKSHILIVNPETHQIVTGDADHYVLLRDDELTQKGLKVYPSKNYTYRPWYGRAEQTDHVEFTPKSANKVYDGSESSGFKTI